MEALFEKSKKEFEGLINIPLLKKITAVSNDLFAKDPLFESDRQVFGKEKETEVVEGVLTHNFKGVKEFTVEFYQLLQVASNRQNISRSLIKLALKNLNHGFNKFDEILIYNAADISSAYDKIYIAWSKAVQGNEVAKKLTAEQTVDPKFHNPYTIIQLDEKGEYYDVPYSTFFQKEIQPIFATAVKELLEIKDLTAEQKRYVDYLEQYRVSLLETDKNKLDSQGQLLDEIWMDIKHYIQFVHDIETGYGDPLRVKIIPDFSIRFLDSEYSAANHTIDTDVKNVMVDYFQKRDADLAKKGVFALSNSFAGVYFLPFQSGMSLHFRFSGQSIPNRPEVKNKKGVKIYFDPVSTAQRAEQVKDFVKKAFNEEDAKNLNARLDAVKDIVYHVAAHEFGHAIYNLAHLEDALIPSTRSLFEEPRAELTALATMKLLFDAKLIDEGKLKDSLSNFAMGDLRRFAAYSNTSTRPYTISATNTYKTFEQCGYITMKEDGKLQMDESKALDVLKVFSSQFERILDAEDRIDSAAIENEKKSMEVEEKIIHHLVQLLKSN